MKLRTLFFSLPILVLVTSFCSAEDFENIPKLILNGEASIQKEADQMEVNLGVVTRDKNSGDALTQNNRLMNQVMVNLRELGWIIRNIRRAIFISSQSIKRQKKAMIIIPL